MEEPQLPAVINPSNFPAKLWRLVNSPRFCSIRWDARGEGFLIDQALFECEVLSTRPGHAAGLAGDGASLFKTKNFTSFIRQLNLYGFRKVVGTAGSVAGTGPALVPGLGNGDSSTGLMHHFHSPHFCRDRPDLLVHLKRLTSTNKAKLAAGLEVNSRPPNCFQRLLGMSLHKDPLLPPSTLGKANEPGLMTVGQFHQPYHGDGFFPYSYVSTSAQNNGALPAKSFDQTPIPSRTWQGSLGLLPGHEASPTFPNRGVAFPSLQRCPTEVTYTLQTITSVLPLQQGSQTSATSLPKYSSYNSSMQYSQAYYPTAALQCCSPAHTDPLTGCASPAASTYTYGSFFQSPPMHPPYTAEFLPSNWPCDTFDENKKTEENLDALFQVAEEMCSSLKADVGRVEPVDSQCSTPQSNSGQLVNIENIDTPSSTEERQLESLSPVASDTSFAMGTDQAVTCSPSQPSEFLCATHATSSVEGAAAGIIQEFVTSGEARENLREQPDHCPAQPSIMFVQEAPFSPEQENASVECGSSTSETEERQFTSGTEPVNKSVEKADSSVKPGCRKRKHSSMSPDHHLPVEVACKRGYFPEEETRE